MERQRNNVRTQRKNEGEAERKERRTREQDRQTNTRQGKMARQVEERERW